MRLGQGVGSTANPFFYEAADYQGNKITITVPWNATTRALQDATVTRDAACVYQRIYIGLGADGTPNSSVNTYLVPAGTTTVTAKVLGRNGLNTVDDVLALQITAGP